MSWSGGCDWQESAATFSIAAGKALASLAGDPRRCWEDTLSGISIHCLTPCVHPRRNRERSVGVGGGRREMDAQREEAQCSSADLCGDET